LKIMRPWAPVIASLALVAGAALAVASVDVPETRQGELRNLVVQDCGSCHGLTLKGGLGRPLLPQALAAFPEDAVAQVILDGIPGTPMPPWRGLLTETEARWIARALKEGSIQ
jgi:cytochrome c55X